MMMRRILLTLVVLIVLPLVSHAQVAVTGNLKDAGASNVTSQNTFIEFTLQNYGSNIPRVVGSNAIVNPVVRFKPDGNGNISGTIQPNNSIAPSGTFYRACITNQGNQFRCGNYLINGAFDLSTATPITNIPPVGPNQLIVQVYPCEVSVASTTWTCHHNFVDPVVFVETFDTNKIQIFPDHVDTSDINTTVITWVSPQAGSALIMHAGSVTIATNQPNAVLQNGATGAQTISGPFPLTVSSTAVFSGTVELNGNTTCKNFENIRCVDAANTAGWTGSDFGAWVNAAISDLPTNSGYAQGTVFLFGPAGGGTVTQSTTVTITSPYVNIIGPGSSALQISCTMNADCWRVHTSPFTIRTAGSYRGFTLIGTGSGNANANGIHIGDIISARFDDITIDNFTGTNSSCIWYDNVDDFTERNLFSGTVLGVSSAGQNGCKKLVRYTNTNGGAGSASFARNDFTNLRMSIMDGQTGFSVEGGLPYGGIWDVSGNVATGTTGKVIVLSGTQYTAGPNTSVDGYIRAQLECTSPCTAGTLLSIPASYTVTNRSGFLTDASGLLTNSVSGQYIQPLNSEASQSVQTLRLFSTTLAGNFYDLTPVNPASSRVLSITDPGANDTFVFANSVQTLTNKSTIAGPVVGLFASGSGLALGTSSIGSGACATAVTVSVPGISVADRITWSFNADPGTGNYHSLTVFPYVTANNINFRVCNPSAASVTPPAASINWAVNR